MKNVATIILLVVSTIFAQDGTITGRVLDATNGSPLMGANVVLEGSSQGAATDTEGRYTISQVVAGEHTLMVTYIGYQVLKKDITVIENKTYSQDLELEPEAIQMETYVVTASRRRERVEDAPAAISVISKAQIRRESNTNLGDYLKGTKGIDFTQSGIDSYNMTARGFNSSFSSRLLTLTDGRMANVPSLRLTAYNVIPVSFEDVEQIEVVLGPASALYGPNAHSGVLNIVTSSPIRTTGTSINIQGGLLSQTDTDLLKKFTFRTAHKFGDFGFKVSGVALAGQDWTHFNPDEYEGHDPLFIGRPKYKHDRLDRGGSLAQNENQRFTTAMIKEVDGANDSWVGYYWGDKIESIGEDASPLITQEMVDDAADDEFNRVTLDNGTVLWFITEEKIGFVYADGIDNDGDGDIDEGIDLYVDDASEIWYDGVDNDGDGHIDESDERGSSWLDRFGNTITGIPYTTVFSNPDSVWTIMDSTHKFGFGDYKYDSEGNIVFDTNNNEIYNDSWGSDGKDNDNDWGPFKDDLGNAFQISRETFIDLNDNDLFDEDYGEMWIDLGFGDPILLDWGLDGVESQDNNGDGDYDDDGDIPPDADGTEANGIWDGETFTDLNGNDTWDIFGSNDTDGDGKPSPGEIGVDELDERDFVVNYGGLDNMYKDANDDGINDFPEFKVRNYRYDLRLDWEPNPDMTVSLSHGFAWARNINITGIARYLADGWIYRYYQARTHRSL